MTVDVSRRLPGIQFEAVAPPSATVLPRMDVAAFVGFATAGPFDLPVAIEDGDQFTAAFGEDLLLAIDPVTGEPVYSQLGTAVMTFLRGGGKRCWVTRVGATQGSTTSFLVPGLVQLTKQGLAPVSLPARSPGSWADDVSVATALASMPAAIVSAGNDWFDISFPTAQTTLEPGDLLRLSGEGWSVLVPALAPAASAPADAPDSPPTSGSPPTPDSPPTPGPPPTPSSGGVIRASIDRARALWIEPVDNDSLPNPPLDLDQSPPTGAVGRAAVVATDGSWQEGIVATVGALDGHGRLSVSLGLAPESAPPLGTLVQLLGIGARELWVEVDAIRAARDVVIADASPPDGMCFVIGQAWWVSTALPAGRIPARSIEKLTLELRARRPGKPDGWVDQLTFAPEHPRWLGLLPNAEQTYEAPPSQPPAVWSDAVGADLPLAGTGLDQSGIVFPLGMGVIPGVFLDAPETRGDLPARNGVTGSGLDGFIDAQLLDTRLAALAGEAEFITCQQPQPRRLRGLHSVMALDEVTLLALPDASRRQWAPAARPPLPPVTAPTAVCHPDPSQFGLCGLRELRPPVLHATAADDAGRATLGWSPTDDDGADYLVQASADPKSFSDAATVYDGPVTSVTVDARRSGPFFRVRAHGAAGQSDWSNGVGIDAGPALVDYLLDVDEYTPESLLAIQRAALRMCAARGDILVVLSLPGHYREDDAIAHVAALRPGTGPPEDGGSLVVPPLDYSELPALTHGALYHPWAIVQLGTGAPLLTIPPDGPATGVIAHRTLARGAWVAPADEPLNDVVGVKPVLRRERLADLQDGRVNVVRQEPAGFVCLDQDTLSLDDDLRPINVRRLLDLLRRLVLLNAPAYVFEPNDGRLRRRIQRGFEAVLRRMYVLGAFSGAIPQVAYQVVTGDPPNTPPSADQGQLIVELQVAPSLPMRFLTVRLVHGAAGTFEAQEA